MAKSKKENAKALGKPKAAPKKLKKIVKTKATVALIPKAKPAKKK